MKGPGSARTRSRRALWIAALFLVPVPLLIFADALVPTMRLLELAVIVLITVLVEGPAGVALLLLALFTVHVVVYAALLWVLAWNVSWLAERIHPRALRPLTFGLIVVGLAWSLLVPIYRSPFHATSPQSTLWQVYQ